MIEFHHQYIEQFLATIRKYMQLRGGLSQKDLAELTQTGISTMSRFLNSKTKEIDPQLAAKIVSQLKIPLHEVVDFIEDDSLETFKKLLQFYQSATAEKEVQESSSEQNPTPARSVIDPSIAESLKSLTPRQKAYVKDFLTLDTESKDLVVDIGNTLMNYFKQRSLEF